MRHPGLTAFALVLLLAAPGVYRELNADGAAAPAPTRIVKVGRSTLKVTLGATRLRIGEPVKVAMTVQNPGPRDQTLELEIALLERRSEPMARVMPPPKVRHTQRVTMVARAGGETRRTVVITLPAAGGIPRAFGRTLTARVTAKGAPSRAALAFVVMPAGKRPAGVDEPVIPSADAVPTAVAQREAVPAPPPAPAPRPAPPRPTLLPAGAPLAPTAAVHPTPVPGRRVAQATRPAR